MISEQQVIKSRMVAERVVDALGLRLRIVEPTTLTRGDLFGGVPPRVDSADRPRGPPPNVQRSDVHIQLRQYAVREGTVRDWHRRGRCADSWSLNAR